MCEGMARAPQCRSVTPKTTNCTIVHDVNTKIKFFHQIDLGILELSAIIDSQAADVPSVGWAVGSRGWKVDFCVVDRFFQTYHYESSED